MRKVLFSFVCLTLSLSAVAQSNPLKTAGTKTLEDGTIVTTTDQALLNPSITNEVDFSSQNSTENEIRLL